MVMTDEEQKILCKNLRDRTNVAYQDCEAAANEIERLAEELQFQYACDKAQQEKIQNLSVEVEQLAAHLAALERM
jgi:phage-related tail protein